MDPDDLFFVNEPFSAAVGDHPITRCWSLIFRHNLGKHGFTVCVGIFLENGPLWTMSCATYLGNVFDAYRATGFLRRYVRIEKYDLATAFLAGRRDDSTDECHNTVISKIGNDVFKGIMSLDIPMELIQKVAQQPSHIISLESRYVQAEIAAGTIAADDFMKYARD